MSEQAEHEAHRCIVARAECGCLWGVHVLDHGDDASGWKDAAEWSRKGADVVVMTVAEFRTVPLRCPGHPEGRWDSRRRVRPLHQPGFGL